MSTLADSPLLRKRDMMQSCDQHGDCIVVFQGRACPLCLALDDAENARIEARRMQDQLDELDTEGPCR